MPKRNISLYEVTVVYNDEEGTEYRQPLSDIPEVGTLIDPKTGDDLQMMYAAVEERVDTPLLDKHYKTRSWKRAEASPDSALVLGPAPEHLVFDWIEGAIQGIEDNLREGNLDAVKNVLLAEREAVAATGEVASVICHGRLWNNPWMGFPEGTLAIIISENGKEHVYFDVTEDDIEDETTL